MLQSNNRRTAHLLEREKEKETVKHKQQAFSTKINQKNERVRESVQKISPEKGKWKSGCWPHCLTFLETTSTHAHSHKQMVFNLTSGSPCTAKARENDEHRKKSSERITVKTRKHVIQLKCAKGIAEQSGQTIQLQRSKKSRKAKQCWLTLGRGMDR